MFVFRNKRSHDIFPSRKRSMHGVHSSAAVEERRRSVLLRNAELKMGERLWLGFMSTLTNLALILPETTDRG